VAQSELLESPAEPEPRPEAGDGAGNSRPGRPRRRDREPLRPARPSGPVRRRPVLQALGLTFTLLAVLVLGFFVYLYGLSGLSEQRAQSALYKTFAARLAVGTAPTGPTAEGAPVAILNIPAIGVHDLVVVEGTSAEQLTQGAGHLRATVLPGQYGVSTVFGRDATYGGPFAHLMELRRGDRITATTGEGTATYIVESFGTTADPAPDPTRNRLLLETGAGPGYPTGWAQVSADLWSAPVQTPTAWPAVAPAETALAGNPDALLPLMLWTQALLVVSFAGSLAAHRWSRWAALLCTAPVVLALVWALYENLSLLLPNLY